MTVRSTKLYAGPFVVSANVGIARYTVPAGFRTLVKSVSVFNNNGVAVGNCTLSLNDGTTTSATYDFFQNKSFAAGEQFNDEIWRVLHAGDFIRCFQSSIINGILICHFSGAELQL